MSTPVTPGQGTQHYLRDGEEGEVSRLYIGGIDSLYRMRSYHGSWVDGVREGVGVMTYINGDAIEGPFRKGQPHGKVLYRFAQQPFTTGTFRALVYNNPPIVDKKNKGKKSVLHDRTTPSSRSRSRQGEREKKGKADQRHGGGSRGGSPGSKNSTRSGTAHALTTTGGDGGDGERPSTGGGLTMVLRRNADMRGCPQKHTHSL